MADLDNHLDNAEETTDPPAGLDESAVGEDGLLSQSDLDALIAAAASQDGPEDAPEDMGLLDEAPEPSRAAGMVDLPDFDPPAPAPGLSFTTEGSGGGLSRVRDIPLEVTVELGRTRLLIRDILDLSPGSIIELDKLAGEPVDLFANGMLVARGEVIVIDDNFGVRVTEIITAAERSHAEKDLHALAA